MDWKEFGLNVILRFVSVFVALLEGGILVLVAGIDAAWGDGGTSYFGPLGLAHFALAAATGYAGVMLLKDPLKGRIATLAVSGGAILLTALTQVLLGYNWVLLLFTIWWFASGVYAIGTLWKPIHIQGDSPR
ncbi:MAG: hypothetical protein ACPHK8_03965 [Thermoplasmatota archaeon]